MRATKTVIEGVPCGVMREGWSGLEIGDGGTGCVEGDSGLGIDGGTQI